MKTCPVCGASCFDDMELCYGCLHRFAGVDDETKRPSEEMSEALESSKSLRFSFGNGDTHLGDNTPSQVSELIERSSSVEMGQEKEGAQDEWVMRVTVPKGCDGVTVRLERA